MTPRAALRGLSVQCGLTSLRGLCTLPAGAPSPASEHRDALRRPGRLVVHRPAQPPPPQRRWASAASGSSVRTRAPSTPRPRSARSRAGGWLGRHIHSFEEALYVLAGELTIDIDGHVHRLVPGDYAHMAVGTWHALANATSGRSAGSRSTRRMRLDPAAGRRDTFFATARSTSPRWRHGPPRPPFGDPDAPLGRPLRRDAAAGRGAPGHRPGPRSRAGRDGHGDPGLQRDLGEDARRPDVRRRPADDVHRRLRAERRRPGPRPPVRGGVLLPRWRDRGRARRRAATRSARAMSRSPASARPTASSTPAAAGCAGSRPRRRSHRPPCVSLDRCLEAVRGDTDDDEPTDASSWSAARRGIGKELARHYAGTGRETVITGRVASQGRSRRRRIGGTARGIGFDLAEPKSIREALASVGPVRYLAIVADPARRQHDPRLRHRPGDRCS